MASARSLFRSLLLLPSLFALACSAGGEGDDVEAGDESEVVSAPAPQARRSLEGFTCPVSESGKAKVLFLDADSTVRVSKVDGVTATRVDDVDILPFAATTIRAYRRKGYVVAIISNQGGVASGKTKYEVAEGALRFTASQLGKLGARVDYWDFAEADDENRKPETGMGDKLEAALGEACKLTIDRDASLMIGDSGYKQGKDGPHPDGRPADDFSNSDRLFAENFGVPFLEPTDAFGWRDFEVFNVLGEKQLVAFYDRIEASAAALRAKGSETAARRLEAEVRRNRALNGIAAPAAP